MKKERTILLGSSIIERWPITNIKEKNIENLGISGLISRELMEKYKEIPKTKTKTKTKNIILYIGSNDITHNISINEIYRNITEFILSIPKTNIIFVAILKSPDRTIQQIQQIDIINRKMREFSQKHPNISFCNLNRELSSPNNYLSSDKKHLSEKGYSILSHHLLST
jgi:lysophospholipase L1-like esterase